MSKTYYAKSNINHNGEAYVKGDTVPVDGDEAQALIDAGALSSRYVEKDEVEDDASNDSDSSEDSNSEAETTTTPRKPLTAAQKKAAEKKKKDVAAAKKKMIAEGKNTGDTVPVAEKAAVDDEGDNEDDADEEAADKL